MKLFSLKTLFLRNFSLKFSNFCLKKTVKTVFFHIYLDFGQHLLTKYCRYDLRILVACKTIVGASSVQFWCQYLQNSCRETILIFFTCGLLCVCTNKTSLWLIFYMLWKAVLSIFRLNNCHVFTFFKKQPLTVGSWIAPNTRVKTLIFNIFENLKNHFWKLKESYAVIGTGFGLLFTRFERLIIFSKCRLKSYHFYFLVKKQLLVQ